jgi:hypothetical protein
MEFEGSNFIHSNENVYKILNIDIKLNKDILYNIEEVLKDYSNPDLESYKPKDGYEFIDKSNYNQGIGIYHTHLTKLDGKLWVLIWYFKENMNNYYDIIFEAMIHPTDNYNQVLKDIKSDPLVINPNTWKNYSEKIILSFNQFIRL